VYCIESIDVSGKSILLSGAGESSAKVELTAGKEQSSLQMQSGSGDIQMYASEIRLESPRNAPAPDLLSQGEVDLLLSEYEKKTDYLTNNILKDVYKDPQTGDLYSVDPQHGRFEHLNKKGKHLGEVDFDFNTTKPADTSGRHDINIK